MFKRKKLKDLQVKISICKEILEAIFDECDANNVNETGGRIIGYCSQKSNKLDMKVCGLIGPGPNARKSPTSFFQDGVYQETVFRSIEAEHPALEHLGNWHSHHVNGLNMLSSGDIDTYTKIVNHEKHNTDFFYALLVVAKNHTSNHQERYLVRHFVFKRGESLIYEIPNTQVNVLKMSPLYIDKIRTTEAVPEKETLSNSLVSSQLTVNHIRAKDKEMISEMYPSLKTFFSKQTNSIYWRGEINLIDNSPAELLVLETINEGIPSHSISLGSSSAHLFQCNRLYSNRSFDSAWRAIYSLERDLNREIYNKIKR